MAQPFLDNGKINAEYWILFFALAIISISLLLALKSNTSYMWFSILCLLILLIVFYFMIRPIPVDLLFCALPLALVAVPGLLGIERFPLIVVWLILFLLLWYFRGCKGGWNCSIPPTPFILPLVLYCFILILSIFSSPVDFGSFSNLFQCIAFISFYWLLTQVLEGQDLLRLLYSMLVGFVVGSIIFLFAFMGGNPELTIEGFTYGVLRPHVLGFNANFWSFYPLIALPIIIVFLTHGKFKLGYWCLLAILGLIMASVAILNMQRSALVGIAVSSFFVLMTHRNGRYILLLGAIACFFLMIFYLPEILPQIENILRFRAGLSGREQIWPMVWEIISDRPILGIGPTHLSGSYFFNTPLMERGLQSIVSMPSAHNVYLNVGAEIGILGPLLILSIFILFAFRSIRLWRVLRPSSDFIILVSICSAMIGGFCRTIFETDFLFPNGYITNSLILITLLAIQDQLFYRHYPAQ